MQEGLVSLFCAVRPVAAHIHHISNSRHPCFVGRKIQRFDDILEDLGGDDRWEVIADDSDRLDTSVEVRSGSMCGMVETDGAPLHLKSAPLFDVQEMRHLDVSFIVVDPSLHGCPIVASSESFSHLTGYPHQALMGLSLDSLRAPVPPEMRDGWHESRYSTLCEKSKFNSITAAEIAADGVIQHEGEVMAKFVGSRLDEELFHCTVLIRQVFLDEVMYLVGVFAERSEGGATLEEEQPDLLYSELTKLFVCQLRPRRVNFVVCVCT